MKTLTKYLILIIFLSSACKKDQNSSNINDTIIFGTVVDSETGGPIEGVQILKKYYNPNWPYSMDTSEVTTTDKEGKYTLKLKMDAAEAERTSFSAVFNGYCYNNISYTNATINECNMRLVKWSYLKLYCKNITPYDSFDDLWIDVIPAYGFDYYSMNFVGTDVDQIKVIPVIGYRTHELSWQIHKNSTNTNFHEEIYFPGGDTIYHSIFY